MVNLAAKAQQEALFSNYMVFRPVTNASFVGADKTINAIFVNRTQFAGLGIGKPVTSVFGVDAPVEIFGTQSGLGVLIVSDEAGFETKVNVEASYAYHHTLQSGTLGGGLTLGINSYSLNPEWEFAEGDVDYPRAASSDRLLPGNGQEFTAPPIIGIGLGAYYETEKYYVGLSVSRLKNSDITTNDKQEINFNYLRPHYYLTGAYNIELPDPLFDLRPSFMLQSDLSASMLNLNGTIYYKNKYWAGFGLKATLHNLAALSFLGGVELMNGLNVGYALDINLGSMILVGATSHEVLVSYSFNLDTKRTQKYKSVRYL